MMALDGAGRVVRKALLWNDLRSGNAAADLIAEFDAENLAERTGLVPVASFTVTKLQWLREHDRRTHTESRLLPSRMIGSRGDCAGSVRTRRSARTSTNW
jgi:sugar (pentulose or hexulose) kinase